MQSEACPHCGRDISEELWDATHPAYEPSTDLNKDVFHCPSCNGLFEANSETVTTFTVQALRPKPRPDWMRLPEGDE